jgi:hypothetical protein
LEQRIISLMYDTGGRTQTIEEHWAAVEANNKQLSSAPFVHIMIRNGDCIL